MPIPHVRQKSIAAVIKNSDPSSHWNLVKYDVIRQVLRSKAESSEVFRQHLLDTGDKCLVESSVTDNYWGSGLSYNLTITTLPELWPGKNKLGKLLAELRNELRSHLATDRESDHCAKQSTSVDIPGQLDVASARISNRAAHIRRYFFLRRTCRLKCHYH